MTKRGFAKKVLTRPDLAQEAREGANEVRGGIKKVRRDGGKGDSKRVKTR